MQYELIKSYRDKVFAPVDTMGADNHFNPDSKDIEGEKFRLLVSLLLSVQTNDKITDSVVDELTKETITKEKYAKMEVSEIHDKIKRVNFSNKKAKHISDLAKSTLNKNIPEE